MPDAYQALDSLRTMLTRRREELKERLASGFEKEETYHQQVGRCKELAETIAKIGDQIKSINGGQDDDETKRP